MTDKLLLKFRAKNTRYGVTRETLKSLAAELDTTETMVIHLAISRFAKEVLPAYEGDDGPLSWPGARRRPHRAPAATVARRRRPDGCTSAAPAITSYGGWRWP